MEVHLENIPPFDPIHIKTYLNSFKDRIPYFQLFPPYQDNIEGSVYQQSNELQMTVRKEFVKSLFHRSRDPHSLKDTIKLTFPIFSRMSKNIKVHTKLFFVLFFFPPFFYYRLKILYYKYYKYEFIFHM